MATVTFKGSPVHTNGELPAVGATAPDFSLVANDMSAVSLGDSAGKVRIISVVPSVDTGVCAIETKRFNTELDSLPENVVGYTVSVDTPFAQKRWCGAEGVEKMQLLSDFKTHQFLNDYGVYITDLGISARVIFIVDKDGKVAYQQLVPEIGQEPDYAEVIAKAKELAA
ncbi:MAG TPA: thiol peroxidase [Abditibacteriaceae bacterium]|jgi:thiol peroxidase